MSDARPSQLKPRSMPSIDGGIADNENKIIIPQNTTANLAEITPQAGSIAYDTDQQKMVFNDGTGFAPINAGGASGANTALSNLVAPTSVNQDLLSLDNTQNVGTESNWFANMVSQGFEVVDSGGSKVGDLSSGAGAFVIEAAGGNGVNINGTNGPVLLSTASSPIRLTTTAGEIDLTSGSGQNINMDANGSLLMSADTGSVSVNASVGDIDLTSNGNIALSAHGQASVAGQVWTAQDTSNNGQWAAAPAPTGDHNTSAYFNNSGVLTDNTQSVFKASINSRADFQGAGTLDLTGIGAYAHGNSASTGTFQVHGNGALAQGEAGNSSSVIAANGIGAVATGFTATGGIIFANGNGSIAAGDAEAGGEVFAALAGSLAHGSCTVAGTVSATGIGAHSHGLMNPGGGAIQATGSGATAFGIAAINSIVAQGDGSQASGSDAIASMLASGLASFAHGSGNTVSSDYGAAFGLGHSNSSYASLSLGRYSTDSGTAGSWVSTDPALVVGNGTGTGARANALEVDKDGKMIETGANKVPVRVLTTSATLSARTDRKLILNGAGALTLTLPAGEEGLCYQFGKANANTGTWTLTPNGADTVDGTITTISTANGIIFHSGVWYQCY